MIDNEDRDFEQLTVKDMDKDGHLDIIMVNSSGDTLVFDDFSAILVSEIVKER